MAGDHVISEWMQPMIACDYVMIACDYVMIACDYIMIA